jgi:hypothetical protein
MKSSGVSRFLSRRDKHQEKRSSRTTPSKVRLSPSASCDSLSQLLPSTKRLRRGHGRQHSQSPESLYDKLPSVLRNSVEDGFLFFQRNAPHGASFPSTVAYCSPHHVSDHLLPQSRLSNQASPDLYTIFTNEDAQAAKDKDVDKKVRWKGFHLVGSRLTFCRSKCFLHAYMVLA